MRFNFLSGQVSIGARRVLKLAHIVKVRYCDTHVAPPRVSESVGGNRIVPFAVIDLGGLLVVRGHGAVTPGLNAVVVHLGHLRLENLSRVATGEDSVGRLVGGTVVGTIGGIVGSHICI
jgi:hypothetical protein